MLYRTTIAAALIALTAVTASTANAGGLNFQFHFGGGQNWGSNHNKLSKQEVRWILQNRNYHHISFIDWHGSTYELTARKHGKDYYIVVSAWNGNIVQRHSI